MLSVVLDSYYGIDRHIWAWGIGTAFALAALIISLALIVETWRHNNYPPLRRYLILVLLMVPVYAIFAWLGLILKNQSQYWSAPLATDPAVSRTTRGNLDSAVVLCCNRCKSWH